MARPRMTEEGSMRSERQRSPSNDTTVSQPKCMVPVRSWTADQAVVMAPVSRAVKTRIGGIPPVPCCHRCAAVPSKAAASPEAIQRKTPLARERPRSKGAEATGKKKGLPGRRHGIFVRKSMYPSSLLRIDGRRGGGILGCYPPSGRAASSRPPKKPGDHHDRITNTLAPDPAVVRVRIHR